MRMGRIDRDLKPDNILFLKGTATVSDLGLCWIRNFKGEGITPEERTTGAWGFRAPEHEHCRVEEIKESADVFSIVKILWWLIHGGALFPSAHYEGDSFDLCKKYDDNKMLGIMNLLRKVMVPEPDKRKIQNVQDLLFEIDSLLNLLTDKDYGSLAMLVDKQVDARKISEENFQSQVNSEKKIAALAPSLVKDIMLNLKKL